MMEKLMRVAVRIRPLLPAELRQNREVCAQVAVDSRQVVVVGAHAFPCDLAFGPTVSQEHVYSYSVKPLLASFFAGKDVTVLAYGQSGSGKTFTLSGVHTDRGVIWRFCEDAFLQMTAKDLSHLRLSVCCVALCGDELKDLLRPEAKHLHIIEDHHGRSVVDGAAEVPLGSVEDLHSVLECLSDSSSHTLLWLRLRQHSNDNLQGTLLSTLLVVDLAGWECVSGLVNTDTRRFKRSFQISTELRTLADTIQQDGFAQGVPASRAQSSQALPNRSHSPCSPLTQLNISDSQRGRLHSARSSVQSISAHTHAHTHSPLMRLLQNSLSGSAQTLLMVCVSPAQSSLTDTVSCLMLAARVQDKYSHPDWRGVRTRPHSQSALCTRSSLEQHAAVLLEELQDSVLSPTLQERLNAWLDAYKRTPSPSHPSDIITLGEASDGHQPSTDAAPCDESDTPPPQDTEPYVQSLQQLKLHCRLQSELLVEQKLLADWLKRDRRVSDSSGQRSPLTDVRSAHQNRQPPRCGTAGSRKVYSSPCNLSLERLSATIKTSNQLLLAQLEEQEQVMRLPSVPRGAEAEGKDQSEKKDKKRPLLNRTWTRKHASDLSTTVISDDAQGTPGCDGEAGVPESRSLLVSELLLEKQLLHERKEDLSSRLSEGNSDSHSEQDVRALNQLEETIEAVDVLIGLRQHHDQQRAPESQLSVSSAPMDSLRVLEDLSLQEAKALFFTYFSKVAGLRESVAAHERRTRELEVLLAADREQSARRLQQLEKEVFFYRSSSRELRRRLKELVQDAPSPRSSRAAVCHRGSGDGGHDLEGVPD